jgi:transposase-like protein
VSTERKPGSPFTRHYTPAEKEQAVRLVRQLRSELGTEQDTIQRVARQLGYGVESIRSWVRQAEAHGYGSWVGFRGQILWCFGEAVDPKKG